MDNQEVNVWTKENYTEALYKCQYLVVGTGAGGSVAGALLAESGSEVIFLEEGGFYPTKTYTTDVGEMTSKLYRNQGVFPFLGRPTIAFAEGCCVGGGTVVNGGLIWRTPPWVLDQWESDYGLRGYCNDDLAKHFETIERDLFVVRHEHENEANLDSLYLLRGAEELGWKCVMVPRAVKDCTNDNLCPTGCSSGAKQSTLETYIPRALIKGARVFSDCRAVKIIHSNGIATKVVAQIVRGNNRKLIEIKFDQLILAGGAIQSPHLLRRSRILSRAGRDIQFHMNLKLVVRFKNEINAEQGTMFTAQIQEFERDGILIMASNLKPHYVAMTLSHYGNKIIDNVLESYQHLGLFTAMIRSKSRARIISYLGDQPVVFYRFDASDLPKIKMALRKTAEVLFQCGAIELYMPISKSECIRSISELDKLFDRIKPKDLEIVTVHVMSSCPMGPNSKSSTVNPDGRLWNMKNILLADASILPSNIGESPQGTIQAFVHEIVTRQLNV